MSAPAPMGAEVAVEVNATSANLGPGFDSMGLALSLADRIEAAFIEGPDDRIEVQGEGAGRVPLDGSNMVVSVIRTGLEAFDESGELSGRALAVRCVNAVPHSRGMGSSAAAIVGGLAVAAQLAGVADRVSEAQMLALATRLEGHPDNVAPAVMGGATIAWMQDGEVGPVGRAARFDVDPRIEPVLVIPTLQASTSAARGVLPAQVPHADACFNVGRSALLVHALTSDPAFLLEATADRLHQQQRRAVYPASFELVGALRERGIPAAISGAGPSVVAFAVGDGPALAERITALVGPGAGVRPLTVESRGVRAR